MVSQLRKHLMFVLNVLFLCWLMSHHNSLLRDSLVNIFKRRTIFYQICLESNKHTLIIISNNVSSGQFVVLVLEMYTCLHDNIALWTVEERERESERERRRCVCRWRRCWNTVLRNYLWWWKWEDRKSVIERVRKNAWNNSLREHTDS